MNNWNFTGNLGNDAESRFTPSGDAVVSFSVGVKSGFGDRSTTTWARCQMWGKRGESVAPYLVKGQLVGVTGELTLREYDKKDGAKGYSLEVRVNDLTLLGKREGSEQPAPAPQQRQAPAPRPQQQTGGFGSFEDDVPFMRHAHGAAWRAV
jgi:single-strand DNA-binding protein